MMTINQRVLLQNITLYLVRPGFYYARLVIKNYPVLDRHPGVSRNEDRINNQIYYVRNCRNC